jgi:peptidyl-prolyl cis-trans isomerase A (cyclophilin A)
MKVLRTAALTLIMCALLCAVLFAQKKEARDGIVNVIVKTNLGDITVAVDAAHAPVTATNFLKYVDAGYYDGGVFHRTVKTDNQPGKKVLIEVVQASALKEHEHDFGKIPLERTNETGLKHLDGTISMARDEADTATSDFFICINDQPELDFGGKRNPDGQGFAAFGQVISGMDVVHKIQQSAADGQKLTPPLKIISAKRIAK